MTKKSQIEQTLIEKLTELKYIFRSDIRNREALESNFRQKFEALNRVHLTDSEFSRLRDEIVSADVFNASKHLREINNFFSRIQLNNDTQLLINSINKFKLII